MLDLLTDAVCRFPCTVPFRSNTDEPRSDPPDLLLSHLPAVSITLKGSRGASAFKIRGELGATSFKVSMKLPCGGEVAVAAAERRQQPLPQRGSVAASSENSSTYDVLLEAGADAAFVAAACIVIDSMYNKSQRYQE